MSRLFQESFDVLTPAQLQSTTKWTAVGSGVVAVAGRTGNGITGTSGASETDNSVRTRVFTPGTADKGYCGIAMKFASLPAGDQKIWELRDDAGTVQLTGVIRSDGTLRTYRGTTAGTLIGTTSTAFVAAAAFRYLEFGWLLQGASPMLELRSTVSGFTPTVAFAPIVTAFTRTWAQLVFFLTDTIIIDDVYLNDAVTTTGGNAAFNGDTAIVIAYPIAVTYDVGYEYWRPNTGSDKIAPVDDTAEDGDSTYLYTRQSYSWIDFEMTQLVDDGRTVADVQMVAIARVRSSSFTPGMDLHLWRWDGITNYPTKTPAGNVSQTGYTAFVAMTQGPGWLGGANTWTFARLNASRFGVRS